MFTNSFILVIILTFHVGTLNCQKAAVPFEVCERYLDIFLAYTFNTPVNNSVFKNPESLLSDIQKLQYCKEPMLNVAVTRTLEKKDTIGNYKIAANYTVIVGIKKAYHYNYSLLSDGIADRIDNCFRAAEPAQDIGEYRHSFRVNISGNVTVPEIEIDNRRENDPCTTTSRYFKCPLGSVEMEKICECSKGWHLKNVSYTKCTKCPKNTYQEKTGMFNCTRCPQGYTTLNETGRANSMACILTDNRMSTKPTTTSTPQSCKKGEYLDATLKNCLRCPINTYKDISGNTACKDCPEGRITSQPGADNLSSCTDDVESGRDFGVLAVVLTVCIVMAAIITAVVFLVFRMKMKKEKERKAREIEQFREVFVQQHETTNEYYDPESSDDEGTEKEEVSALGYLAEDVARRNLEIPRDCITITKVTLGRGQFGEVKQALIRKPGEPEILCAAKMARGSRIPVEDMVEELEIHLKLEEVHENVVNLIGVCSSGGPFYLIIEYCENGSLIDYLKKHDSGQDYVNAMAGEEILSLEWKQSRTLEICNGMKYLAKHRIVHRDLAARNVLLDMHTVAKISDFGMAKDVYMKSYYTQKHQGCFPLRWMAMESIKSFTFTEKTDVWSFGVLVWEIFTNGNLPYYEIINDEKVVYKILDGKKLKQPENCPKYMYSIMLRCWSDKSYNRPNFAALYHILTEHIQQQPKRVLRKFSRDILKQFELSGNSIKRKFSRKGSRNKSFDATEPHTSSRRSSRHSLDGIELHQPPQHKRRKSRKEDGNQHVDPLNKIEEDKLEQCPDDHSRNSSHRSGIGKAPYHSSNSNQNRSSEHIPTTRSKSKLVENNIKDDVGETNSEMNLSLTPSPNDSLHTDQGSEKISNLQHQDVDDDSTTDPPRLMNMIDDVHALNVDEQHQNSENHLDSNDGSSQSVEDNPTDTIIGHKTDISHSKTPEEVIPTIPNCDPCSTTDLDELSDKSSEGDERDVQHKTKSNNDSLPQINMNKNEESSPDKMESEGEESSRDGSDFLSDVLNAINVSPNDDTDFSSAQNEKEEQDPEISSSC